jgi:hypothetical protein
MGLLFGPIRTAASFTISATESFADENIVEWSRSLPHMGMPSQ